MTPLKRSTFSLPVASRGRRALCWLAVLLPALFLAAEALREAAAATLGDAADARSLELALALDPANASVEHRLGLVLFYDSRRPEAAGGLAHLRRATQLDPAEALYWWDLASACEASHNLICADPAAERALALSPETPRLQWSAANFYLRTGRRGRAIQLFRRLLASDASYAAPVFEACQSFSGGPEMLEEALPRGPQRAGLEISLVDFLSARGDPAAAALDWRQLVSEAARQPVPPFDYASVEPYVDRLIASGETREAQSVWSDLARLGVIAAAGSTSLVASRAISADGQELVFNGGFERAPLNSGFDWRYAPSPFLSLDFASEAAHSGRHSLRVDFSADRNDAYEPVWQFVTVDPNRSYVLSTFVRTDGITSGSGPRLLVQDALHPASLDLAGPGTVGTTAWHEVQLAFNAGARTRMVKLSLWRPRSRSFPSEIQGVYWLDDVSLRAVNEPGEGVETGTIASLKPHP
jgi:tetratricopeptide (TPR) repeat protein